MAAELTTGTVGVGVRHERGWTLDRPQGSGDYVFIHFHHPVHLCGLRGETQEEAEACILYAPPHRQAYRPAERYFTHDWLHFGGRAAARLLKRYGLPLNAAFRPRRTEYVPALLAEVRRETAGGGVHAAAAVGLLVEHLLLLLSRHLQSEGPAGQTPRRAEQLEGFRTLRAALHEAPEQPWSVAEMAAETHLSPPRFAALYREFFGVPPVEELLQLRVGRACWLLTNTALSVADVARESGFNNIYYFSRMFRRRVGCPPRDYYRLRVASASVCTSSSATT